MANLNLPVQGEEPWDSKLNAAVAAVNSETEQTTAVLTNGRLSEANLNSTILSNAQDLTGRKVSFLPAGSSGQESAAFMQRLKRGESASLVVIGDSTGVIGEKPFPLLIAEWLAASFPTATVDYRVWNDASNDYLAIDAATSYPTGLWPQTTSKRVQAGGAQTITVWNGSVPGSKADYPVTNLVRWNRIVGTPAPHLVLINYGHNSNGVSGDGYRSVAFPTIRAVQQQVPQAGVLMCAQNPRTQDSADTIANDMQRQRANALLAATEGLGLVNFTDRFLAQPDYATAWTLSDSLYVHPNAEGSVQMAQEFKYHLAQGIETVPRGPSGRQNVIKLGPRDFMPTDGNPTLIQVNGGGMGWACPPGVRSDLIAHVGIPEYWLEYNIILKWSTPTVASTFVAWQVGYRNEGLGLTDVQLAGSTLAFPGTWANLTASPYYSKMAPGGTTGYAIYGSSLASAVPVTTRELGLRISRRGDVTADDTYTLQAFPVGVLLVRTK